MLLRYRSLSLCAALLAVAGCSGPALQTFRARLRAESDPGVALGGVVVSHDGVVIGETDAQGLLPLDFSGAKGERISLEVRCPATYRASGAPLVVVLRQLDRSATLPEYRAVCRPQLRTLVVAVRSQNGTLLPLRYLGRELARTDGEGAAHGVLSLPPGESVTVVLDTSSPAHRYLRPQNPALRMTMPDRDDVVLFDQPFVVDAPKPIKLRPRPLELPVRF